VRVLIRTMRKITALAGEAEPSCRPQPEREAGLVSQLKCQSLDALSLAKRVQILSMPLRGSSMRSISRVLTCRSTRSKLLIDAGCSA